MAVDWNHLALHIFLCFFREGCFFTFFSKNWHVVGKDCQIHVTCYSKGWKRKCSMCFGIKKQIEPFHTQPYSNYYCFGWFHGTLTPEILCDYYSSWSTGFFHRFRRYNKLRIQSVRIKKCKVHEFIWITMKLTNLDNHVSTSPAPCIHSPKIKTLRCL